MKKNILIAIMALCFIPILAYAQGEPLPEGYVREEANGLVTIYNQAQLQSLFGVPSTAEEASEAANIADGIYRLFFEGKPIGVLYGTIVADAEHKKLTITDGGFISPRTEINEQASSGQGAVLNFDNSADEEPSLEVRMVGKKVEIDASNLPWLVMSSVSGRYAEHKYSFVCNGKCRLTSMVMPTFAYLNITGAAKVIKTTALKEYQDGKAIDRKWYENISGLNEIGVLDGEGIGENIVLSAFASTNSNFGNIVFKTSGKLRISRSDLSGTYSDSITPHDAMKLFAPGNINAFFNNEDGKTLDITLKRSASAVPSSINLFGAGSDNVNLFIKKGSLFLTGSESQYRTCSAEPVNCIFGERGLLKLNPGEDIDMSVTYPALSTFSPLEMLELGEFETDAGKVNVNREGVKTNLLFSYNDIQVENGNWFELGLSFSAYVYDGTVEAFNNFRCDVTLKECYLDGEKVVGFEQQHPISCMGDWDCGTGKKCINPTRDTGETFLGVSTYSPVGRGRCVTEPKCTELTELNPSPKPSSENAIDVLLIPDGYGNREQFLADARKVVDRQGLYGGLLAVSPFMDYKDKFVFYTLPLTQNLPSMQVGSSLAPHALFASDTSRLCPGIDQTVVISKNQFRSSALLGESAVVSVPASGSMTVAPHEFGHLFGMLADEYNNNQGGIGHPHDPNCLTSEDEARSVWTSILSSGSESQVETMISLAKTFPEGNRERGCGGDCGDLCKTYFRPSYNSLMNYDSLPTDSDYISGGESFNLVSKKWLIGLLGRYA
ncbi:MAG: hypothetical protein WC852_06635 [Candidatus Nanoarchaeia archaeon]|jgi:hypothetical protein